jgi:hypothetical protein
LAASGAGAGAAVASAPAERVLTIQSWIIPQDGRQTVGENWARRWTLTRQPPDMLSSPPKGIRPKDPSEANRIILLESPPS